MKRTDSDVPLLVDPGSGIVPMVPDEPSPLDIFQRLAVDPNASVEKIERLMALWERGEARKAEAAFNASMSEAQTEMRPVGADAHNPSTHSRYASYQALDDAVRPIYTRHGFGLSFNTGEGAPTDHVRVLCYVSHRDGFSRTYHLDMPSDGKGAKGGDVMTKTHAVGSAATYGMRYLLKMIFNVAVGEDDDDGNKADGKVKAEPPSPEGYDAWLAALEGIADEGEVAFEKVWADPKTEAYRRHLATTAPAVLAKLKTKSRKVKK